MSQSIPTCCHQEMPPASYQIKSKIRPKFVREISRTPFEFHSTVTDLIDFLILACINKPQSINSVSFSKKLIWKTKTKLVVKNHSADASTHMSWITILSFGTIYAWRAWEVEGREEFLSPFDLFFQLQVLQPCHCLIVTVLTEIRNREFSPFSNTLQPKNRSTIYEKFRLTHYKVAITTAPSVHSFLAFRLYNLHASNSQSA